MPSLRLTIETIERPISFIRRTAGSRSARLIQPGGTICLRASLYPPIAVLAGFGGVSKTQLALQLAIAVALGNPFMGKAANVIVMLGEEDRAEIDW